MKRRRTMWFIIMMVTISLFLTIIIRYLPGHILYDLRFENPNVTTFKEAKIILDHYRTIKSVSLPHAIKTNLLKEKKYVDNEFLVIPKKDVYKKIFLHNRINQLLSKEQQTSDIFISELDSVYLCMNQQLLEFAFHMTTKLNEKKYNSGDIVINSGFRSQTHNDRVKGALNSQHLYGKALDLQIGDINRDGKININDKNIVYQILDKDIIANKGGLGYYPGTQVIHMDVRGYRARWDEFHR